MPVVVVVDTAAIAGRCLGPSRQWHRSVADHHGSCWEPARVAAVQGLDSGYRSAADFHNNFPGQGLQEPVEECHREPAVAACALGEEEELPWVAEEDWYLQVEDDEPY